LNHKNILTLGLRLASIFMFVSIVQSVPDQIASSYNLDGFIEAKTVWLTIVVPSSIKLLFSILFWFFPFTIINFVVPDSVKSETSPEYFNSLNSAFVSVVGIYLLAVGVSDLAYYISLKSELKSQFSATLQPSDIAGYVATIVQVMLGILLILGNKVISKIVLKVRS
jgi:hypothetical protein